MIRRPHVRMLLASAATVLAVALAGCNSETLTRSSLRANQPLSPAMVATIAEKNMSTESPILVRIFKQESELEVWKKDRGGRYALLKTYPICRWSGELGPKVKEGDRQAPEGFYTVTPGQMNPNSSYYLAFNMGYPNAFDRALGRTGSELMVHGDCSSRGCYAMTDEQMGEIYALARESFFGGQNSFQVQAFPFRMTAANIAKHRNNPHMRFWRMLKKGYDHFEVTRLEPKVNVCEKRYVFNAAAPAGATSALSFSPTGQCPTYEVPSDIAVAVAEKEQRDAMQVAALVQSGTPAAPIKMGTDGGMNPVFLAALEARSGGGGSTETGGIVHALAAPPAPGTIPATVNPPRAPNPVYASESQAAVAQSYALAGATSTPVTITQPAGGSVLSRVTSLIGFGASDTAETDTPVGTPQTTHRPAPKAAPSRPARRDIVTPPPRKPVTVATAAPQRKLPEQGEPRPALRGSATVPLLNQAREEPKPTVRRSPSTTTAMAAPGNTIIGAQPVRPIGSFESRWSAFR